MSRKVKFILLYSLKKYYQIVTSLSGSYGYIDITFSLSLLLLL